MSDYLLPIEVIREILLKVPVDTLLRCQAVCKEWNCLIKQPSFLSSHLLVSKRNPNIDLLVLRRGGEYYSMKQPLDERLEVYKHLYVRSPGNSLFTGFNWLRCCEGLVCLELENHFCHHSDYGAYSCQTYVSWNPIIHRTIRFCRPVRDDRYTVFSGVGFDSINGDYKLLRLSYKNLCRSSKPKHIEGEVFSVNGNSWKTMMKSPSKYGVEDYVPYTFANGAIHWIVYTVCGLYHLISRFNVFDETFDELELPHCFTNTKLLELEVKNYKDSTIILLNLENEHIHIWTMAEYGVVDSWTKLFSHKIDDPHILEFSFKTVDHLLLQLKCNLVALYMDGSMKILFHEHDEECDDEDDCQNYCAHNFVESLGLLGRGSEAHTQIMSAIADDSGDENSH